MKTVKKVRQTSKLTPEAQRRLIAYTTAVGFGALFGSQAAKAQVTESTVLAPYPFTASGNAITNAFSVLGDNTIDFQFAFTGKGYAENLGTKAPVTYGFPADKTNNCLIYGIPKFSYLVDSYPRTPTNFVATANNFIINYTGNRYMAPLYRGYPIPWTAGEIIDSNAWNCSYQQYGADPANGYSDTFPTGGIMGFTFVRTNLVSTNRYYGYMDIQITGTNINPGYNLTVSNIYYNATPGVGIIAGAVPGATPTINVTNVIVGAGNAVTINFTSSDNSPASAFRLLTSPTLGTSASWAYDTVASITSGAPGVYQAVTTNMSPVSFYRIAH